MGENTKPIDIEFCSKMEEDFIMDLLEIDSSVYDPSVLGSYDSVRSRYEANRDSCILAFDGSKIVGYVAFFPISDNLSERMRVEDKSFDDDIKAADILPSYESDKPYDVFLISIAILPEYQGKGIGTALMKRFFSFMYDKRNNGSNIRNIYTYAYTDGGAHVLGAEGFFVIKKLSLQEYPNIKFMRYSFQDKEEVIDA